MNINLLSQNLLLVLCFVSAILISCTLFIDLKKWKDPKRLAYLLLSSLVGSSIIYVIIAVIFKGNNIPLLFIIFWPLTLSIGICVYNFVWKKKKPIKIISGISILISLVFGLTLVNNYYQYYPYLYNLLGINHYKKTIPINNDAVTLQFVPTSHAAFDAASVERQTPISTDLPTVGKVLTMQIPGTLSHFKSRTSYVYVPPVAFSPVIVDLPVVVLLSGDPGQTTDWLYGGQAETTLNALATRHNGVTPIVVMTDSLGSTFNDTECVDSSRGNVETYLTKDVPNFIKSQFNVFPEPNHWAIGGLSTGGLCGIMLTLTHPDVYRYFLDFGGEIGPEVGSKAKTVSELFGGSETAWQNHQPSYLLDRKNYPKIGGFFGVGQNDTDTVKTGINQLYTQALNNKLDVIIEVNNGRHTFSVWSQEFKDALPWLSNRIGATVCGVTCY